MAAHEGILIHWNEGFLIGIKNTVYFSPLTGL